MKIRLLLLFIILIFIGGCFDSVPVKLGNGINVGFISPKSNFISENEEVQVVLEITNFNDVDFDGSICIWDDVDNLRYGGIVGGDKKGSFCLYHHLNAYDKEIKKYDKTVEDFGGFIYNNLREGFNIYADVYYPVDLNILVDNFCIQKPLFELLEENKKTERPCSNEEIISGPSLIGNSAPLTVSSIKKILRSMDSNNVKVDLEVILDKIEGVLVDPDGFEVLEPYFNFDIFYKDKRFLCKIKDTNTDINYGLSDSLKLKKKAKEILTCSALFPAGSEPEFGNLDINLNYHFKQMQAKRLDLKRISPDLGESYEGGEI